MCTYLKKVKVFPAFKQQLSLLFTQPYNVHLQLQLRHGSLFNYEDNYELFSLLLFMWVNDSSFLFFRFCEAAKRFRVCFNLISFHPLSGDVEREFTSGGFYYRLLFWYTMTNDLLELAWLFADNRNVDRLKILK